VQDGVDDVSLTLQSNTVEVAIKDFSGGNSLAGVDIKPVTTHLTFPLQSRVSCAKNSGGYSHMQVGFGAFNPTFLDALVLHSAMNPEAGHTQWSGNQQISEAPGTYQYQVALNALKNPALPDYELDPVAEFNKAKEQFVSQGGTEIDYLRQNRTIEVTAQADRRWAPAGRVFPARRWGRSIPPSPSASNTRATRTSPT
jgi:hypothetical protein